MGNHKRHKKTGFDKYCVYIPVEGPFHMDQELRNLKRSNKMKYNYHGVNKTRNYKKMGPT